MTPRPVPSGTPNPGPATTRVAGPGDRPHLPPVQPAPCHTAPAATGAATSTTSRRSARKAPLGWLPWLLLGLLAATLLLAALLAKAASGTGDGGGEGSAATAARQTTGQGAAGQGAGQGPALSAGGTDLLSRSAGGVGDLAGERASGTARVESVVADEGLWIGADAARRVFVFLTPEARRSAGESGFQVEAGQTVSLEGTVKQSSPEFARAAGVTDAEGSRRLVQQGGYVEASEVRLAQ